MKYIITMLLLLPIAAFSTPVSDDDGGDNHAKASQAVGNADSTQGLNLDDKASDSLLWTYPTFSYGYGYYRNYYPYYGCGAYNFCGAYNYTVPYYSMSLPVRYHGVRMMGHHHHMDKMKPMEKADDK